MIKYILLGLMLMYVTKYIIEQIEIKRHWKEWENNSFEWNGYRFNKNYYEVIDGELKEKK